MTHDENEIKMWGFVCWSHFIIFRVFSEEATAHINKDHHKNMCIIGGKNLTPICPQQKL